MTRRSTWFLASMTRGAKGLALACGRWVLRRLPGQPRSLRGRVVLITGASGGFGLALAREAARAGCRLAICARDQVALDRAAAELTVLGAEVLARRCDVADPDQVTQLVDAALEQFGSVDVLVNNADLVPVGAVQSLALRDFGRAMAINFWGPLHLVWAVLPHMRSRGGGQIVNITSLGGKATTPGRLPNRVARAAMISLSDGLGAELAKNGIRVTTVVPGLLPMSPERAAERVFEAVRRRARRVALGWQGKVLVTALDGLLSRVRAGNHQVGQRALAAPRGPSLMAVDLTHAPKPLGPDSAAPL